MNNKKYAAIFLLLGVLTACSSSIYYGSDFQAGVNFSELESFTWHSPNEYNERSNNYIANEIADTRIRQRVSQELQSKDFGMMSNVEDADFLVNYSIITEDKIDINSYNLYSGYAAGWRYGGSYGFYGYPYRYYGLGSGPMVINTEKIITEYTQGTFVLDIINASDDKLLWRGTAEGTMPRGQLSSSEREELISEVVGRVLRDFPPGR